MPAEVGIKSCRFARECVCMDVSTQLEHEQTQIVANAAYRLTGSIFLVR